MKRQRAYWNRNRENKSGSADEVCGSSESKYLEALNCLEMDIKMVWIPVRQKPRYLLSIIDVQHA